METRDGFNHSPEARCEPLHIPRTSKMRYWFRSTKKMLLLSKFTLETMFSKSLHPFCSWAPTDLSDYFFWGKRESSVSFHHMRGISGASRGWEKPQPWNVAADCAGQHYMPGNQLLGSNTVSLFLLHFMALIHDLLSLYFTVVLDRGIGLICPRQALSIWET